MQHCRRATAWHASGRRARVRTRARAWHVLPPSPHSQYTVSTGLHGRTSSLFGHTTPTSQRNQYATLLHMLQSCQLKRHGDRQTRRVQNRASAIYGERKTFHVCTSLCTRSRPAVRVLLRGFCCRAPADGGPAQHSCALRSRLQGIKTPRCGALRSRLQGTEGRASERLRCSNGRLSKVLIRDPPPPRSSRGPHGVLETMSMLRSTQCGRKQLEACNLRWMQLCASLDDAALRLPTMLDAVMEDNVPAHRHILGAELAAPHPGNQLNHLLLCSFPFFVGVPVRLEVFRVQTHLNHVCPGRRAAGRRRAA